MLLIEHDAQREPIPLPAQFTSVKNDDTLGIDLAYGQLKFGRSIGVWLLRTTPQDDRDDYRRFRIHLLRLHAQSEVVTEVLRAINTGKLPVQKTKPSDPPTHPSNRLQKFLNDTIKRMEQHEYSGVPQSELLRAATLIQDSVSVGQRTTILQQIEPLRKGLQSAVERFMNMKGEHITVVHQEFSGTFYGNVTNVVADTIQNSFNRIDQSTASEELKTKLAELHEQVKKLLPQLPEDQQKKVAKNLDKLTEEATAEEPDREWYEVSAKGLMDAAKTVADMAAPITTAVKAVLALLV